MNMKKTAVMVFNCQGRLLNCSSSFKYGSVPIQAARNYTYLGIVFNINGSFKDAIESLRKKALRSYFGMKKLIDWKYLRRSSIIKLIDALLVPVLTYRCKVWMPQVMQNELFALLAKPNDTTTVIWSIAKNSAERMYLSILKWVFGVHKKTSNAAIWGDGGMYPLLVKTSKQVFNYFCRVTAVDFNEGIAKDAVAEQKALGLSWFSTLEKAHETISGALPSHQRSSSIVLKPGAKFRSHLEECFCKHWEIE